MIAMPLFPFDVNVTDGGEGKQAPCVLQAVKAFELFGRVLVRPAAAVALAAEYRHLVSVCLLEVRTSFYQILVSFLPL